MKSESISPVMTAERAGKMLRAIGLRRTYSRINVLCCLSRQTTPVTQAEIVEELAVHGFDSSTIYRGLTELSEHGLVVRVNIGDRVWRYELRDQTSDGTMVEDHHPHAVCIKCGKVECLHSQNVSQLKQELPHWEIVDSLVRGICEECKA